MFDKEILPLSDSLYRMARSILQDADEAHDAVQDLLMNLWEKRNELTDVENLNAFVFRSLRNKSLDMLRRRKNNNGDLDSTVSEADSTANVKDLIGDINEVTTRQNYEELFEVREKGEKVNIYFKELGKNKTELLVVNSEKSGEVNLILISGNITPEEFKELDKKDKNNKKLQQ